MKKWTECSVVELNVASTAFGPTNPNTPDSEDRVAVTDANGDILGWEKTYGEPNQLSGGSAQ